MEAAACSPLARHQQRLGGKTPDWPRQSRGFFQGRRPAARFPEERKLSGAAQASESAAGPGSPGGSPLCAFVRINLRE